MTHRPTIPLPRRGLSREEAAIYIGISPTYFDTLVQRKVMPQPKRIGSRTIWDMWELDLAFGSIPGNNGGGSIPGNNGGEDTWADR